MKQVSALIGLARAKITELHAQLLQEESIA